MSTMATTRCLCRCHRTMTGDFREASQVADFWRRFELAQMEKGSRGMHDPPETTDPLAAVFACVLCRNNHVAALTAPPRPPSEPWVDPPPPNTDEQADGN